MRISREYLVKMKQEGKIWRTVKEKSMRKGDLLWERHSQVLQERRGLRQRKETCNVTVTYLWVAVIFSTLFCALCFVSIPSIPQLVISKKQQRDDYVYKLQSSSLFVPYGPFSPSNWSLHSSSILFLPIHYSFISFKKTLTLLPKLYTINNITDHSLKGVHIFQGFLELYRSILKAFFLNEEVSFVLQQHDQT